MYSGYVRARQSFKVAVEAAREKREPLMLWPHEIIAIRMGAGDDLIAGLPHLGDHKPPGWRRVRLTDKDASFLGAYCMVHVKSDFTRGGYTPQELASIMRTEYGYAFVDEKRTQIAPFKKLKVRAMAQEVVG